MKRIGLVNTKGGVGKTTSAIYLAAIAARSGPVILIDTDKQASAAEWLEERPIANVTLAEAPSERLLTRTTETAGDATVIIDTPPGDERLIRCALDLVDVAVIPARAGGVEISRVQATLGMIPAGVQVGLVFIAAEAHTLDYRETTQAWVDAGIEVLGSVPKRVAIAHGPDGPLSGDGLDAYQAIFNQLTYPEVTQ